MPLINPTIAALSQFKTPFDLISTIELPGKWINPTQGKSQFNLSAIFYNINDELPFTEKTFDLISTKEIPGNWINPTQGKSQFNLSSIFYNIKDELPFTEKTFDLISTIELPGKWINPTLNKLNDDPVKPDNFLYTYDPTMFVVTGSYNNPKAFSPNPEDNTKVLVSNTNDFTFTPIAKADNFLYTYEPQTFVVTGSYNNPKAFSPAPNDETKVLINSVTGSAFTPRTKPDTKQYTYDPTSFTTKTSTDQYTKTLSNNTNAEFNLPNKLIGAVASTVGSILTGIPQVGQAAQAALMSNFGQISAQYSTLNFDQLTRKDLQSAFVLYPDFRAKRTFKNDIPAGLLKSRVDGVSAAFRGSKLATAYSVASGLIGAYSIFNLDGGGQTGYGIGDHGTPLKIRNDFTMRSHVAKQWDGKQYINTKNIIERGTPFVGDRVNVIDYQRNVEIRSDKRLRDIYKWNNGNSESSYTRDFIKFFFTGPNITKKGGKDDVIVFRAIINSIRDSFQPQWTPQQYIGRADANYVYSQYSRDLDLDFTIYASDRDEVQPIWRKLNALASYTTPEYKNSSLAPIGPWMRITLGDLYQQQPCFISSLTYTLHDSDTTWEINIEDDPAMMQTPHKIGVSMGLTLVTDTIPQKNGVFYGLDGQKTGWLKDFITGSVESADTPLVPVESATAPLVPVEGVVRNNNFNSINPIPSFNLV